MHDSSQEPEFTPDPGLFGEPDIAPATTPKKRPAGRPKSETPYDKTIQLRLSKAQLSRVTELAKEAKCTRSAVIRAGLERVQVVRASPHPEQRQQHRELVRLASNLNQLLKLAHTNKALLDETQQAVKQVRSLLEQMTRQHS